MLIAAAAIPAASFAALAQRFPAVLCVFFLPFAAYIRRIFRQGGSLGSHGTARTARESDMLRRGMLGGNGLIMGRVGFSQTPSLVQAFGMLLNPGVASDVACQAVLSVLYKRRWSNERIIRIKDFVHLLTVAPAGAGKSVSVLVPNLLSYQGSCVVTDPKGELWSLTAAHRHGKLGQRVFLLDPFGVCRSTSAAFNPLDAIDANQPEFLDQCKDLANMLVVRTGEEKDPHWNDMAEIVLTAFIAYVCACEPNKSKRTLETVRKLVSSPVAFTRSISTMKQTEGFHDVISRHGKLLQWMVDRELGSVMTTVQRHTAWMDSPQVAACLSHTTFDPRLLRTGRVTVYFVLPHDKLVTLSALMRTWIGTTLRLSTRGGANERNPVLFLLDEAGHLGHMQALQDAVTLLRGYGIRLWFFFQDLGQLQACYGKHASIMLGNMQTQQYFAINNDDTAEAVSKRIGDATILVDTQNGGGGTSWPTGPGPNGPQPGNRSYSWGWSTSATGRRMFKPEEIRVLPEDLALIFHKNMSVIPARLLRYFDAPEFKNGGDGRQGGMGLACLLTMAASVFISAAMIPVSDEISRPVTPQPGFQAIGGGLPPARQSYGFDLRRRAIDLPPIPLKPTAPVPHPPDASNPWKFDRFELKTSPPSSGNRSGWGF